MRTSALARFGLAALTALLVITGAAPAAHAALATGTVAGHLTTASGDRAVGAGVAIFDDQEQNQLATGYTDDNGYFRVDDVRVGKVKVQFSHGFDQWATGQRDFEHATVFTVAENPTTIVDNQLLPGATISGRLVDAAGEAVVSAGVSVEDRAGNQLGTSTDEQGRYSLDVLPGDYKVSFNIDTATQWAPQQRTAAAAPWFPVAVGQSVTVDETLLPTGTIIGSYVDEKGKGVAQVDVRLFEGDEWVGSTTTDDTGAFTLGRVFTGRYKMSFTINNDTVQWAYGKLDEESASIITVTAGEQTRVDEKPPPSGTITGRFTTPSGAPVAKAKVNASADGEYEEFKTTTDARGNFRLNKVPVGEYKLSFTVGNLTQWAYGKWTAESADPITVRDAKTTTVQDTQLPPATVRVTAQDAATGAPVKDFCAEISQIDRRACTTGSTATLKNLPAGKHSVSVSPAEGSFHLATDIEVTVEAGATASVAAPLTLGGRVTATATSRATGKPVQDACIFVIRPVVEGVGEGGECTDKAGTVSTYPMLPGTYNVFVRAPERFGAQWLGASGGTGDQREAAKITVEAGKATAAPPVKLDGAGSIAGVVTTAADGKPVSAGDVAVQAWHFGLGSSGDNAEIAETGRYTLTGVGPYRWPLVFTTGDAPRQWSGNTGDRFQARTVEVVAGKTVTYNEALVAGATIKGKVSRPGPVEYVRVFAYNAVTGDAIGDSYSEGSASFEMSVIGEQEVTLEYDVRIDDDRYVDGWHGGTGKTDATRVAVPKVGSTTVEIPVR